jgi:hypothetical protein
MNPGLALLQEATFNLHTLGVVGQRPILNFTPGGEILCLPLHSSKQ